PQHDDVDPRQFVGMLAKRLSHQPLQAVPVTCLSAMFLGYRKSKPGLVHSVFPGQDREQFVATPAGFGKHTAERVCAGQAVGPGETMVPHRNRSGTGFRTTCDRAVFVSPRFVRCVRYCWVLRSNAMKIGRASCRERVWMWVGA